MSDCPEYLYHAIAQTDGKPYLCIVNKSYKNYVNHKLVIS